MVVNVATMNLSLPFVLFCWRIVGGFQEHGGLSAYPVFSRCQRGRQSTAVGRLNAVASDRSLPMETAEERNIFLSDRTFRDQFGDVLPDHLLTRLESLEFHRPTLIQQQSLRTLLKGRDVVMEAEAGSGKSLAYLLPILQAFEVSQMTDSEEERQRRAQKRELQSIVVVPSRELGLQVVHVARELSGGTLNPAAAGLLQQQQQQKSGGGDGGRLVSPPPETETASPFEVMGLLDGDTAKPKGLEAFRKELSWMRFHPPSLVVATPHVLLKALEQKKLRASSLRVLVIDEVDALLAGGPLRYPTLTLMNKWLNANFDWQGFFERKDQILKNQGRAGLTPGDKDVSKLPKRPRQTILTSATIPNRNRFLKSCFSEKWTLTEPLYISPERRGDRVYSEGATRRDREEKAAVGEMGWSSLRVLSESPAFLRGEGEGGGEGAARLRHSLKSPLLEHFMEGSGVGRRGETRDGEEEDFDEREELLEDEGAVEGGEREEPVLGGSFRVAKSNPLSQESLGSRVESLQWGGRETDGDVGKKQRDTVEAELVRSGGLKRGPTSMTNALSSRLDVHVFVCDGEKVKPQAATELIVREALHGRLRTAMLFVDGRKRPAHQVEELRDYLSDAVNKELWSLLNEGARAKLRGLFEQAAETEAQAVEADPSLNERERKRRAKRLRKACRKGLREEERERRQRAIRGKSEKHSGALWQTDGRMTLPMSLCRAAALHEDLESKLKARALAAFRTELPIYARLHLYPEDLKAGSIKQNLPSEGVVLSLPVKILVSTDLACRGMDFPDTTHALQMDLPPAAETFAHRIGRAGRMGRQGWGYSIVGKKEEFAAKRLANGAGIVLDPLPESLKRAHGCQFAKESFGDEEEEEEEGEGSVDSLASLKRKIGRRGESVHKREDEEEEKRGAGLRGWTGDTGSKVLFDETDEEGEEEEDGGVEWGEGEELREVPEWEGGEEFEAERESGLGQVREEYEEDEEEVGDWGEVDEETGRGIELQVEQWSEGEEEKFEGDEGDGQDWQWADLNEDEVTENGDSRDDEWSWEWEERDEDSTFMDRIKSRADWGRARRLAARWSSAVSFENFSREEPSSLALRKRAQEAESEGVQEAGLPEYSEVRPRNSPLFSQLKGRRQHRNRKGRMAERVMEETAERRENEVAEQGQQMGEVEGRGHMKEPEQGGQMEEVQGEGQVEETGETREPEKAEKREREEETAERKQTVRDMMETASALEALSPVREEDRQHVHNQNEGFIRHSTSVEKKPDAFPLSINLPGEFRSFFDEFSRSLGVWASQFKPFSGQEEEEKSQNPPVKMREHESAHNQDSEEINAQIIQDRPSFIPQYPVSSEQLSEGFIEGTHANWRPSPPLEAALRRISGRRRKNRQPTTKKM
uniref:Uncharacterized protein n=1 Tax=Chromera velia CCMP2878 TaxID=1169474 RepID=A0A0G4GI97_9ALVE|eukprot:Cvel_22006.t1-p1 / transcript=Cvel_22006.t1 / gene=Cvel_22006 / organism=Chromera_velia_CCMP2878 / gene_product=DEAD-box ATP-dependent RNA helicase 58,, putative / transcript_product=DEAD-box ATP-dependent RNA helicase 58,, putative / location=Cvel_scaffold2121:26942-32284(-) / protein_length=1385 / sequence_SO=supercontig / SO=protein_coding / is_pseudo=false